MSRNMQMDRGTRHTAQLREHTVDSGETEQDKGGYVQLDTIKKSFS